MAGKGRNWGRGLRKYPQNLLLHFGEFVLGSFHFADFLFEASQQNCFFKTVADDELEVIVVPGLFDVLVESDVVDGFDGVFLVGISGQQDSRDLRKSLLYSCRET